MKINIIQKMSNNIRQSEMDILNRCILEKDDLGMSTHFKNMEDLFKKWTSGQKTELKGDKAGKFYNVKNGEVNISIRGQYYRTLN